MKRVFLGGTCNGDTWREHLKSLLEGRVDCFDPVVPEWTDEARAREVQERDRCDYCLYFITPRMKGVYSIAEAVEDAIKRPRKCVFAYDDTDVGWDPHALKSIRQVGDMVFRNGGSVAVGLRCVASLLTKGDPERVEASDVGSFEEVFAPRRGVFATQMLEHLYPQPLEPLYPQGATAPGQPTPPAE
jgi:hypothetical protein